MGKRSRENMIYRLIVYLLIDIFRLNHLNSIFSFHVEYMFKKQKILNFMGRINAFRVIERLERMNILGGQNI